MVWALRTFSFLYELHCYITEKVMLSLIVNCHFKESKKEGKSNELLGIGWYLLSIVFLDSYCILISSPHIILKAREVTGNQDFTRTKRTNIVDNGLKLWSIWVGHIVFWWIFQWFFGECYSAETLLISSIWNASKQRILSRVLYAELAATSQQLTSCVISQSHWMFCQAVSMFHWLRIEME